MRLPKMPKRQSQFLSVPDLAGGLNLRDGMSEILDNQLTDAKNMWFKDGVLKTRPSLSAVKNVQGVHYCSDWESVSQEFKKHNITMINGGRQYLLCSTNDYYDRGTNGTQTVLSFWWVSGAESYFDSRLVFNELIESYFVIKKDTSLYLFATNKKIYLKEENKFWQEVPLNKMYVPLVAAHCKTSACNFKNTDSTNGTMIDGFNLLTEYYKMTYSSYNDDVATELEENGIGVRQHLMIYHLLYSVAGEKYIGKEIRVDYTLNGVTYNHKVIITDAGGECYEEKSPGDGMIIAIHGDIITFYKAGSQSDTIYAKESEYAEDNLVITAPYLPKDFESAKDAIFQMTESCWFGGASTGLAGGNRLFLCGNKAKGKKSLVRWSGLDDPLYFSENAYFYVGDDSSAVTGFGKQSDKLIIFKENETWYTQYYQNTGITAESLINQSVVDLSASSVYFPLIQINPNIGCPYPDTVQLCRNRLVWLGKGGKVYTLVSENQYNERSIYSVSEMVGSRLKEETSEKVCAVDWNGYYCLCYPSGIYLMDYNTYGYTHIASHSKTEDANLRIPWYYWENSSIGDMNSYAVIGNELTAIRYNWGGRFDAEFIDIAVFGGDVDVNCESTVTTKLFFFSAPHYRKNIDRIDLQFGNNGGEPITVELITDCGSETHFIEMQSPKTDKRQAGYIENRAIFPNMRQITQLALKISCKDRLIIDGMIFKYRITGGVR